MSYHVVQYHHSGYFLTAPYMIFGNSVKRHGSNLLQTCHYWVQDRNEVLKTFLRQPRLTHTIAEEIVCTKENGLCSIAFASKVCVSFCLEWLAPECVSAGAGAQSSSNYRHGPYIEFTRHCDCYEHRETCTYASLIRQHAMTKNRSSEGAALAPVKGEWLASRSSRP
jgi:hypothetical protein